MLAADVPNYEKIVSADLFSCRLTLVGDAPGKDFAGRSLKLYRCLCGKDVAVAPCRVKSRQGSGNSVRSCGCLKRDRSMLLAIALREKQHAAARIKNRTHGQSHTPFYMIYKAMMNRCYRPKDRAYERYGGRGIEVCARWHRFENFRDDMYESYLEHCRLFGRGKATSIDRIDNDGDYELSNCRWATAKEQANNTRRKHGRLEKDKLATAA